LKRTLRFAAWILLALAVTLRIPGVLAGVLYGEDRVALTTVIGTGGALVIVALWPERQAAQRAFPRKGRRGAARSTGQSEPPPAERTDRISRLNLIAGTITALVASVSLLLPASPSSAAETPCRGAPLRGASSVATTQSFGANARSGPGESFEQVYRFSGDCSIGVVGYCLGEPTNNAFFKGWTDNRWLVVPRHRGWLHVVAATLSGEPDVDRFVAAGVVFAQSPDGSLRRLDHDHCGPGDSAAPGAVSLKVTKQAADIVLTAHADRAPNIGFALWLGSEDTTGHAFRQIVAGDISSARWKPQTTAAAIHVPTVVTVLAQPCLAPSIPSDDTTGAIRRFTLLPNGEVTQAGGAALLPDQIRDRLVRTACQSPP
jgi:hypothetical protein